MNLEKFNEAKDSGRLKEGTEITSVGKKGTHIKRSTKYKVTKVLNDKIYVRGEKGETVALKYYEFKL